MLAVNQNEKVWVRTINQHEVITVDYGGAYWLKCWTRLSQSHQNGSGNIIPPHASRQLEKWTGQLDWEYAMASKNIYDVLTDRVGSDESKDDDPDTISTSTAEDNQGRRRGRET